MNDHEQRRIFRAGAGTVAALGVLLLTMIPMGPALAAHGPDAPGGPYSGYTSGAAVHADLLTTATARLADVEVGVADAAVDSEGLKKTLNVYQRRVAPDGITASHSRARSSLVEVGVGLMPPDADNQVKPFVAEANAPGGEPVDASLLNQTVSPLVHVSLLRRVAEANWNSSTCIIGEPISTGEQHLARVELLETGDDATTPVQLGFDKPVIGIDADKAGPRRAATHIISREQLYKGAGPGFGLQSVVTETLAPVTLLQGTANEFTIEVNGPAYLVAQADGTSGGAKVIYRAPIVSVIQGGEVTQVLPQQPVNVRLPGPGDAIAHVKLGTIEPLPALNLGDATTKANGTVAAAQANVVEVALLDAVSQKLRGATVGLGHLEAAATVPVGGISCPIPVTKTPNPAAVEVGDQFTTTITIDNPFKCPVSNLSLVDEISVEQGARFEVVDVSDGGNQPGGSNLSSATITWSNLGTLQPGAKKSVTVTMTAQGAAGIISDTATAGGTLDNCEAKPGSADTDVSSMTKVKVPVSGKGTVDVPATSVLGKRVLPRTGLPVGAQMAGGVVLLAAAALLMRRLRRVVI